MEVTFKNILETSWKIDICREPIHIKVKKMENESFYKRTGSCLHGLKNDFCEHWGGLKENLQDYGLIFAEGEREDISTSHGQAYCTYLLLQRYLDGEKSANAEIYQERCKHSSNMEYLATKAERDSIKYMQIRFMQDHQDEAFVGVISGVTDWGIYVEIISNKCEGMVRTRDIKGDYYEFDKEQFALIGQKTKTMYQLGEEVVVKVKQADLIKRHLDFELIGKPED